MSNPLPHGWRSLRLDQLGTIERGRSRHRPRNDPALYGGKYPFVQTGDIKAAGLRLYEHTQTYNETGLAQSRLWPEGTLCITIAANICDTAILGIPACFPDSVVGFTPDHARADVIFVKYTLDHAKRRFADISRGATQDNLSLEKMLSQLLPVPPILQQRRIGSILSAYDDLIEVNRRRIAVLEDMARRLFDERIACLRSGADAGNTLLDLPPGWTLIRLGDIAAEIRHGVMPSAVPSDTPYVGLEHLPRRSTTLGVTGTIEGVTSLKFRFRRGDILFGKIRPYFHKVAVAPFDGVCSSDTIVLRAKQPDVRGLVLAVASSDVFVAHAVTTSNGTKMPRANWSVLSKYSIPLPPPVVLTSLDKFIVDAADAAAVYQASSIHLAAARDLLLPRLISGELPIAAAEREIEKAA